MNDHDKLREAIKALRGYADYQTSRNGYRHPTPDQMYALADAAESTLPKTKMVDCWYVTYAFKTDAWWPHCDGFRSQGEAEQKANNLRGCTNAACIRVTGPHQQEVPA